MLLLDVVGDAEETDQRARRARRDRAAAAAGADTFVAGSAIFGQPDYKGVIDAMRAQLAGVK